MLDLSLMDSSLDLLGYPVFIGAHVAFSRGAGAVKHGIVKSYDEESQKIKIKGINCVGCSKFPNQVIVLMILDEGKT